MTGTNAKPEGKGTSRVATQGAIGGLLLGVAAFLVRPKAPRVSAEATTTERHKTLLLEDAAAALSPAEITAISTSFGSTQPVGKFLRGRHGVTHYYLQSPESRGTGQTFLNAAGASRLIVMTHGIGTNMQLYDKVVSALLDDGFTVLRYDYFGHGWSAPDDKYGVYDKTMINEQLEDLLDHVTMTTKQLEDLLDHVTGVNEQLEDLDHMVGHPEPQLCHTAGYGGKVGGLTSPTARGAPFPVYGFVGHSTGGCVGVLAASALKDYKFERLYLVSPCFWKEAPLLSNLAGKVPAFVTTVSRSGALDSTTADSYATAGIIADFLFSDAYAAAGNIAWMREGGTGAYLWPDA
ncbi:Alpha/Beta hydrolase protein, partial [Baffinella frigidus]